MLQVWSRKINAFGIHPYWLILLPFLVFGLITMLFWKTDYAGYVVMVVVFQLLIIQVSPERMSLLKTCFSLKQQRSILALESTAWILPIIIVLLYHRAFIPVGIIVILTILWIIFPWFRLKSVVSFPGWVQRLLSKLPPFEFQTGLRRYFLAILLAVCGIALGEIVNNALISIFAFGALGLIYLGMHSQTEPHLWVWISNQKAKQFLLAKMGQAIIHVLFISGPLFVLICLIQPSFWWSAGLLLLLHIYFAQIALLMKYSVFPSNIGVPAEVVLSLLVIFVPLGIIYCPFLFKKSVKQISWILP